MRKLIYIQLTIGVVSFLVVAWIFIDVRPREEKTYQLEQQIQTVEQDNARLKVNATPTAEQTKTARLSLKEGRELFHQGRYDDAVTAYDKAIEILPNDPYSLGLKGYALFKAGKIDDSIEVNKESIELDPEDPYGYLNLAKSYCAAKRFGEAKSALMEGVPEDISGDLAHFVAIDGELRRKCRPILQELSKQSSKMQNPSVTDGRR